MGTIQQVKETNILKQLELFTNGSWQKVINTRDQVLGWVNYILPP